MREKFGLVDKLSRVKRFYCFQGFPSITVAAKGERDTEDSVCPANYGTLILAGRGGGWLETPLVCCTCVDYIDGMYIANPPSVQTPSNPEANSRHCIS